MRRRVVIISLQSRKGQKDVLSKVHGIKREHSGVCTNRYSSLYSFQILVFLEFFPDPCDTGVALLYVNMIIFFHCRSIFTKSSTLISEKVQDKCNKKVHSILHTPQKQQMDNIYNGK